MKENIKWIWNELAMQLEHKRTKLNKLSSMKISMKQTNFRDQPKQNQIFLQQTGAVCAIQAQYVE